MALVNYAKNKGLKYLFVIEDDLLVNSNLDKYDLLNIFNVLTENTWCFDIFNGSPTFSDEMMGCIKKFTSPLLDFFYITSGLKTTMIIYTSKSYGKILEYNPYICTLAIDQYICKNFTQLCYKSFLFYENDSYSDIENVIKTYAIENSTINEKKYKSIKISRRNIYCELSGGIGNNLFQMASIYSISKKWHCNFIVYDANHNPHKTVDYFYNNIFKITYEKKNCSTIFDEENCTQYINYELCEQKYMEENILFSGYFQNEKYFENNEDIIKTLFSLEHYINIDIVSKINQKSYFIHFRRGDYNNSTLHNINLEKYYTNAINYLEIQNDKNIYYIFSDDIQYCMQCGVLDKIKTKCIFMEGLNELETLYCMSICSYGGICANSTFSWWGSYLNKNKFKQIIFPDKWFNKNFNIYIYPKNSIIMKT